jgi:hypothetical protein
VRISERKRQLRDSAGNPEVLAQRQSLRASAQAKPVARKASGRARAESSSDRTSKGASAPAANARVRKPRGSGFYTGFGAFGLCFAIIFGISTITTYRSDNDKYPTKLAQYHTAQATYTKQLSAYDTAVSKHAKKVPAKPKAPAQPTKPALSAGSFMLPVLYGVLSIAYLYLGYRARTQAAAAATGPPSKRSGVKA